MARSVVKTLHDILGHRRTGAARSQRLMPASRRRRPLTVEVLEHRLVLSDVTGGLSQLVHFQPTIVAGDPNASPADSPAHRVDPNSTASPFAGVGSLFMRLGRGPFGYICTGTPIDSTHVVTAGHCLDTNNDGSSDFKPDKVTFNLNFGGDLTHSIRAAALDVHPDFTGFNNPHVNDDLAIITLVSALPAGVPTYALAAAPVDVGNTLTMVGYGRSGDGVSGYYVDASFAVKRSGANNADQLFPDDEGVGPESEVFWFDFDGPDADRSGPLGGGSLGNTVETTLGGGDSGGPSFVDVGGALQLAGVNTFTMSGGQFNSAPLFGSGGGGILVHAYLGWINDILTGTGGGGGGGNGKGGGPKKTADDLGIVLAYLVVPPLASPALEQPASNVFDGPSGHWLDVRPPLPSHTETADAAHGITETADERRHEQSAVAKILKEGSGVHLLEGDMASLLFSFDENMVKELASAIAG